MQVSPPLVIILRKWRLGAEVDRLKREMKKEEGGKRG